MLFNEIVYYMWDLFPVITSVISFAVFLSTFIKKITKKMDEKNVKLIRIFFITLFLVSALLCVYQRFLIQVPDVTGRTYYDACIVLKDEHFLIKDNEDLIEPSALVVSQDPMENTFVLKGSSVQLNVEQETTTEPTTIVSTTERPTIPNVSEKYDNNILQNGTIGIVFTDNSKHFLKYDYLQQKFVYFEMEDIPTDYCKINIHIINDETNSGFDFTKDREKTYALFVNSNESFYGDKDDYVNVKLGYILFQMWENDITLYCQPGYYTFTIKSSDFTYYNINYETENHYYTSDRIKISKSGDITIHFKMSE